MSAPRSGSIGALVASLPDNYLRDPEWLRLSNEALRAFPGSPRQQQLQARMREIERLVSVETVD